MSKLQPVGYVGGWISRKELLALRERTGKHSGLRLLLDQLNHAIEAMPEEGTRVRLRVEVKCICPKKGHRQMRHRVAALAPGGPTGDLWICPACGLRRMNPDEE